MKKIITLQLLFVLFGSLQQSTKLFAQSNSRVSISAAINSVEAQVGDPEWQSWGYAKNNFNNNGAITNKSISVSIIPKYFISKEVLLRFEVGITNINMINHSQLYDLTSNPNYSILADQSIEQKIYRFAPGLQWNFMKKKFIETYCGVTASYLHYADMTYKDYRETKNMQNNVINDGYDNTSTATGGFAAGVGAFGGFNIYLNRHISLGAETSFSYLYKKIGNTFNTTGHSLVNPTVIKTSSMATNTYKGTQFSKVAPSFNISVWF